MATGNQGARGPLITWTVIASIVCVIAIVAAIYFYVDASHANDQLNRANGLYSKAMAPETLRGEEIANLEAAKADPARGYDANMRLFDVAIAQRNGLAKLVGGSDNEAAAVSAGKNAIEKAKAAGATLSGEPSLVATVDALVARVESLKTEAENNKNDSVTSQKKLTETLDSTAQQIKTLNDEITKLQAARDEALQSVQTTSQQQTQTFGTTAEEMNKQLASSQDQINLLNSQNAELGSEIQKLKNQIQDLMNRLGANRVDTAGMMTRQVDGKILRVPGGDRVFIDLGSSDHVSPGLTFEVFDKYEGVPPAGDPTNERNLPVGKASIEVITVLPTGSECRIIRKNYGAALSEGDLIVNLVYDRNTKYNFIVYGNFDIDQNGVATPQDAEVIKRLVTRWGGNVVEQINVDTDFVVLGKEPSIPETPDPNDPLAVAVYNEALAASQAYEEVSRLAREYRLPILNQNRFLYLTGYYSQSRR